MSIAEQSADIVPRSWGWPVPRGGRAANVESGHRFSGTTSQVCGLYPFATPSGSDVRGVDVYKRQLDVVFEHETPYTIVTVDLDGGGRLVGRSSDRLHIGDRVRPRFADHDSWTELCFEPAS